MNKKILGAELLLAFLIALGFRYAIQPNTTPAQLTRTDVYKNKLMAFCSPDWSVLNTDSLAATITPLPGWGNYSWKIETKSDSAQFYFNQGINMYYAFHIIESMASFKKAEHFDANNAMILWGQALAYGPNINDFAYTQAAEALQIAQKANEYAQNMPSKEKTLINAMQVRYSADTTISRTVLNAAYADAMKQAYSNYNNDADVATLFADALLLQHPWEYWKHNGEAHPWTPEILAVLENTLKFSPEHPGANHYYIHATEASPNPGRALPSADRLGKLMPEVSHMVHMPSHIYIRTGNYEKGITVNEMSVKGYNNYLNIYPAVANNVPLYLIHNLHMQAACAMFRPNYSFSLKSAIDCIASFDTSFMSLPQPLGNFVQYVYMTPQMVNVRYGKWNEILKDKEMPGNYGYGYVLSLWSKGMAFANTGDVTMAKLNLGRMRQGMNNPDLKIVMTPFNAPFNACIVAEKILEGTIYEKTGDFKKAIISYKQAVKYEDALIYTEPRDWLIPSRHYLANAQIKIKYYAASQNILLEDLKQNPANFYALFAMEQALKKQGKKKESIKFNKEFHQTYKESDLQGPALIY